MHIFFFFNDPATTEIYTLSLHDALPIFRGHDLGPDVMRIRDLVGDGLQPVLPPSDESEDRKSTRLNSSHLVISYAVFCLKKKKIKPASRRRKNEQVDFTWSQCS